MKKSIAEQPSTPAEKHASEVVSLRPPFEDSSPLDQIIREGAQRMLQAAIDAEVDAFIDQHAIRRDEQGRRLVVRNGSLPAREILTGAGPLEVKQGRVRDNSPDAADRVEFSPSLLPTYLRRTTAIEELIPWPLLSIKSAERNFYGCLPRSLAIACWRESQRAQRQRDCSSQGAVER